MRVHVLLADVEGRTLKEESFDSTVVSIGASEAMMFAHRGLPKMDVIHDGYHARLRVFRSASSASEQRLARRNRIELGERVLHIDLYPRPEAVPRQRGVCPACGDALVEHQAGGAYRSIARVERRCASCESLVLALHDAAGVGKFADRSAHEWVHVGVASRCPACLESMTRATWSTDRGTVEVERCLPCALVVLGPEDERRLRGRERTGRETNEGME